MILQSLSLTLATLTVPWRKRQSQSLLLPGLAIAHLNRARILSDMKQDREAGDEFVFAAHLAPDNPDCYFYWSFVERAQGNFTKEAELLQKVVKLEPGNVKAHVMLANNLLDQNRTAEAVAELRVALAIDPNSTSAIYRLSRALLTTDPEESKRLRSPVRPAQGAELCSRSGQGGR